MENKKKKLKGMSLVEIIISLAVMAIMGILLITLGTTIDSTTRATNKLKSKIVQQSPYAAARATSAYVYDDDGKVILDSDGKAVIPDTYLIYSHFSYISIILVIFCLISVHYCLYV